MARQLWINTTNTRTAWDSSRQHSLVTQRAWTALDAEAARDGAATKRAFTTTAERGTPKRKAKLAGGPKNRQRRRLLVAVTTD